jgi:hypothetical protein
MVTWWRCGGTWCTSSEGGNAWHIARTGRAGIAAPVTTAAETLERAHAVVSEGLSHR